ncbi:hypothetical protein RHMOL_Rhmol13G0153200 [Rhododendron molle]|uniref:Uncharacterized protein n=1 Tax=Rhododendron molle TaxID=49168 RepID=A0ACC0L700_RHOML|nr:hypothetical protein RHMOL_Rhmol13G0153200 [Rhododendron molle]
MVKGKRDANSTDMVSGESSSSQSAFEVSNGIPSVLVDLPNLDEVQPTTTSEVVPILASEIVVKDSVGIVVKGPVVHAPSNQANGGQRAACAQSIQGQVVTNEKLKLGELTSSQKNVLGLRAPPSPVLQQVLQEDSDDSEADLLEVLEGVVRSVINDPSNFQKATTSPTSIANNPTVITPSKQPTKAAKKASKAAWSDNRISQHVPNPDGRRAGLVARGAPELGSALLLQHSIKPHIKPFPLSLSSESPISSLSLSVSPQKQKPRTNKRDRTNFDRQSEDPEDRMGQKSLIYAFVSRGPVVLSEFTEFTGNFNSIALQCLQKLPTTNNKFTYNCDAHTFNYLVDNGFSQCRLAPFSILFSFF